MEQHIIYTQAPREEIERFVRMLPGAMAGTAADMGAVGEGFRSRLAHTWFSLVADDFDRLGRGEPGADGRKWPRNSPQHLAYNKGPKSSRMGRGRMPMNLLGGPGAHGGQLGRKFGTGDLSAAQLKLWWRVYSRWKSHFIQYLDLKEAKARAAQEAWKHLKSQGASTLLARLGDRPDQVLVDRGTLRWSLQPGELIEDGPTADYQPASGQQVFEDTAGSMAVGSKTPYAAAHHEGRGRRKRTLWPGEIPDDWWSAIVQGAISGLARLGDLFR